MRPHDVSNSKPGCSNWTNRIFGSNKTKVNLIYGLHCQQDRKPLLIFKEKKLHAQPIIFLQGQHHCIQESVKQTNGWYQILHIPWNTWLFMTLDFNISNPKLGCSNWSSTNQIFGSSQTNQGEFCSNFWLHYQNTFSSFQKKKLRGWGKCSFIV